MKTLRSIRGRTDIPADALPLDVAEECPLAFQSQDPLRRTYSEEDRLREDSPCLRIVSADVLRKVDWGCMKEHRANLQLLTGRKVKVGEPLTDSHGVYRDASLFITNAQLAADRTLADFDEPDYAV